MAAQAGPSCECPDPLIVLRCIRYSPSPPYYYTTTLIFILYRHTIFSLRNTSSKDLASRNHTRLASQPGSLRVVGGPTRPHRRSVNRSATRIESIDDIMGGRVESIESTVNPLSGTTCPLSGMVYQPAFLYLSINAVMLIRYISLAPSTSACLGTLPHMITKVTEEALHIITC